MSDPDRIRMRISEAQSILAALGLPPAQQNTMCARALLALLDLTSDDAWSNAADPLRGIHAIMRFSNQNYGTNWAENTRESFRKDAIHYFEAAHLVVKNPDDPNRPTNSGKTVYQITPDTPSLIRGFGTDAFPERLTAFLSAVGTLLDRHAARRTLQMVPLRLNVAQQITLSPGPHSDLIEVIIREFAPRFTPDGVLVYAGDTGRKWDSYFDEDALHALGVTIDSAGAKMPDVVIHYEAREWLVVVEAFDSVGPIDPLRRSQLKKLFAASTAPVVYVTAFHTMQAMGR